MAKDKWAHARNNPDYEPVFGPEEHYVKRIKTSGTNGGKGHLEDHERAHTGQPGSKVDHGPMYGPDGE